MSCIVGTSYREEIFLFLKASKKMLALGSNKGRPRTLLHHHLVFTLCALFLSLFPASAEDKSPHCVHWAKSGECGKRQKYMWSACADACTTHAPDTKPADEQEEGAQQATATESTTPAAGGSTDGSLDKSPHCVAWAKTGECAKRKKYMWTNCRTTCLKVDPASEPKSLQAEATTPPPAVSTEVEPTTTTAGTTTTTETTTTTTEEPTTTTTEPTTTTTESTTTTQTTTTTTTEVETTTTTSTSATTSTSEEASTTTTIEPTTTTTQSTTTSETETTTAEPAATEEEEFTSTTTTSTKTVEETTTSTTTIAATEEQTSTTSTATVAADVGEDVDEAGVVESTLAAAAAEAEAAGAAEDDGLILQPVADYGKMDRISENEFQEEMAHHDATLDDILDKLNRVETRGTEDLLARKDNVEDVASSGGVSSATKEATAKKGVRDEVKSGRELLEQQLKTVPTVNQMRTKFANINARAAQFDDSMTDSPFGGELDEMLSYGFVSLDSTIVTNVQAHLLCYAKGIHGEGRCRIIKTMAGRSQNDLLRGDSTEMGITEIRNVMLKPIATGFFILCHDSANESGCLIIEVKVEPEETGGSGGDGDAAAKTWPSIVYHAQPEVARFRFQSPLPVAKLLSLIVTRGPIHTDLRSSPAEFAVCYKVQKKRSYQCDHGTFDNRDPLSLKLTTDDAGRGSVTGEVRETEAPGTEEAPLETSSSAAGESTPWPSAIKNATTTTSIPPGGSTTSIPEETGNAATLSNAAADVTGGNSIVGDGVQIAGAASRRGDEL